MSERTFFHIFVHYTPNARPLIRERARVRRSRTSEPNAPIM